MGESLLKKEFNSRDVNRARNLVNKDFTSKTTSGTGYQKAYIDYTEGDTWEENGRTWTIKNGVRQNITKLDAAKKALHIPLSCPKCKGSMKHHLSQKMYKIHKMCFDCVIDYEAGLKRAGLYPAYEKAMMQGGVRGFLRDIEQFVMEQVNTKDVFVTEHGDIEDWNSNDSKFKEQLTSNLQEYLKHIRSHID